MGGGPPGGRSAGRLERIPLRWKQAPRWHRMPCSDRAEGTREFQFNSVARNRKRPVTLPAARKPPDSRLSSRHRSIGTPCLPPLPLLPPSLHPCSRANLPGGAFVPNNPPAKVTFRKRPRSPVIPAARKGKAVGIRMEEDLRRSSAFSLSAHVKMARSSPL
jgi:hypothetical protein